jgi:DNA repair photolyase
MRNLSVTEATRSKLLVPSKFSGYDLCLNPYVGCQFGCTYCYVRFFVKDAQAPWGEFVRVREHLREKLRKELPVAKGKRVVFGTMTDPYQPQERKHRLTRHALQLMAHSTDAPAKVGIFTRSPIILDDLDLLRKFPWLRVNFTVTPYDRDVQTKLEPISIQTDARFRTMKALKAAGIQVYANVAPVIPVLSDHLTEEFAQRLVDAGVDGFFVDPMQTYKESFQATFSVLNGTPKWSQAEEIMTDKAKYIKWKQEYYASWIKAWSPYKHLPIVPILSDHQTKLWFNMQTLTNVDKDKYTD